MNKKSTGLLLSILGVLSLVLITAGVTYAFFSYAKEGETKNTLTTGTITFYYDEQTEEENGISIEEAMPMDDNAGMALKDNKNVFKFKVTSTVSSGAKIPYAVTVRKDKESTLGNDYVKVYLTATGDTSSGTAKNYTTTDSTHVKVFSQLGELSSLTDEYLKSIKLPDGVEEKVIYTSEVPANSEDYTTNFELRMWISGDTEDEATTAIDYSPYEFVATEKTSGTDPLKADDLIQSGDFITSTEYYAKSQEERSKYERIAYVNMNERTIISEAQASNLQQQGTLDTTVNGKFTASEQFYSLNGQTFKLTVNVYANAVVVQGN